MDEIISKKNEISNRIVDLLEDESIEAIEQLSLLKKERKELEKKLNDLQTEIIPKKPSLKPYGTSSDLALVSSRQVANSSLLNGSVASISRPIIAASW